jgi:hypothetical protein
VIESNPGFGAVLGASLLVAAGDLAAFPTGGHSAAAAGLVPVPNNIETPSAPTPPVLDLGGPFVIMASLVT